MQGREIVVTGDADMHILLRTQSPEHWSKDFVEHLRTVHFALLSASVGLILLLASRPYDARTAMLQLDQIIQLKKGLSDGSAIPMLNVRQYLSPEQSPDDRGFSAWFEGTVIRGSSGKDLNLANQEKFTFHAPEPDLFWCESVTDYPIYRHETPQTFFNTMREFREWWDHLDARGLIVDRILSISSVGSMKSIEARYAPEWTVKMTGVGPGSNKAIELRPESPDCGNSDSPLFLTGSSGAYIFNFPVPWIKSFDLNQHSLYARFPELEPGLSEKSFSDLVRATVGRQDEDLETLASQISDEALKGDTALDAFGIKIPSNQVTRWGIVLLIGMQLYLVMYLRRLRDNLKSDDPGWDVPWMAMDQSVLAQVMLFVSLVLLPSVAALFVFVRAQSQLLPRGWKWFMSQPFAQRFLDSTQVGLMLAGFCLSVTLSVLCWKYRPRLAEPIAPAQLFE